MSRYSERIFAHYYSVWPDFIGRHRLEKGPFFELPREFEILEFRREPGTQVFATCGMSQLSDPQQDRLELHLLARSRADRESLVELLTVLAHFHRTRAHFGLEHSLNFGRPWLPGSQCDRAVISLPYLDGPRLEILMDPGIRFLWLIPVTQAEVDFKAKFGMEALEQRFEQGPFDYLDPLRASVV